MRRLRRAGARNVTWIHSTDRRRSDHDEAILGPLREARGIWFGGGRHWHFVDAYQNTTAHRLMHEVLERGGVIAGASAGASIQSDYMTRGDPRNNKDILAEGYERGRAAKCLIGPRWEDMLERSLAEIRTEYDVLPRSAYQPLAASA